MTLRNLESSHELTAKALSYKERAPQGVARQKLTKTRFSLNRRVISSYKVYTIGSNNCNSSQHIVHGTLHMLGCGTLNRSCTSLPDIYKGFATTQRIFNMLH